MRKALIGQAGVFILALDQADLTSSMAALNVNSSQVEFADDIGAVRTQLSSLLSSPKRIEEALKKICHGLLQSHPDSIEALECCLKISMKLGSRLLAQKIVLQLKALGQSIAIEAVEFINSGRDSELWTVIPTFAI